MGLDVVELVLQVEETFAVDLPNDELESVRTVGDLYNLLLSKLEGGHVCLTSRSFYRVRRSLTDTLKVPRRSIGPATELAALLPRSIRRNAWAHASRESGLRFPELEYPDWFETLALCLSIVIAIGACAAARRLSSLFGAPQVFHGFSVVFLIPVGCVALALVWKSLHVATPFLGNILPIATTGELARSVLACNYPHIREGAQQTSTTNQEEIWQVLRGIIVEQLQVPEDEVVKEARFNEDLGAD